MQSPIEAHRPFRCGPSGRPLKTALDKASNLETMHQAEGARGLMRTHGTITLRAYIHSCTTNRPNKNGIGIARGYAPCSVANATMRRPGKQMVATSCNDENAKLAGLGDFLFLFFAVGATGAVARLKAGSSAACTFALFQSSLSHITCLRNNMNVDRFPVNQHCYLCQQALITFCAI